MNFFKNEVDDFSIDFVTNKLPKEAVVYLAVPLKTVKM